MGKKSKYKEGDFFDFMQNKIWPQITDYIDEYINEDKNFEKDYYKGHAALILAYGDGGMANWGTQDALYQRVGNIMFESLRKGIMTKRMLKNLCNGAIEHYEEYINGTEKV